MKKDAAYWIKHLQLTKHPEGGHFKEYYRSSLSITRSALPVSFNGNRSASTAIYFLLEKNEFSALHRIASDELWHFYAGDGLVIYELMTDGSLQLHRLGNDVDSGEVFQVVVRAGSWFGASLDNGGEYALVGCTVAPGFDFEDFELAERSNLTERYPQHREIIKLLTKG